MDLARLLHRLQTDNTSGASTLLALAVDILDTFAGQNTAHDRDDFHAALQPSCKPSRQPSLHGTLINLPIRPCSPVPILRTSHGRSAAAADA
jgi:hypothetical protein